MQKEREGEGGGGGKLIVQSIFHAMFTTHSDLNILGN